jgi:hypothetical protein
MKNEGRKVFEKRPDRRPSGRKSSWTRGEMEPVGGKFTIFCPALRQGMGGGGILFYFQSLVFSFLYEFPLYKTVKRTWIKMFKDT